MPQGMDALNVALQSIGVAAAVARARAAQLIWGTRSVQDRIAVLSRFRKQLFSRRHEVAACISRETGKPEAEAMLAEVLTTLDLIRFAERHATGLLAPQRLRSSTLALWRKRITILREPYGVVGIISPWNYPLMLPAGHVVAALVTGNTVVLKPSELTPLTAELIGELLRAAGLPEGVLEIVQGAGDVGEALVEGEVDKVFFTGSLATGRRVAARCGERLVPCTLELGGSDPAIVLDDADLAHAARGIAWGRFSNAGQTCVAAKRVYVLEAVHDAFVAALRAHVQRFHLHEPGDTSWDIGRMIHANALASLGSLRDEASGQGARIEVLTGSESHGVFPPTIALDVPPSARILHEETFGPLLPIVRVRDQDEAIASANASPFGLSASVWTRSRSRGHAIARRLQAGTVVLNDVALIAGIAEVLHGGVKGSGHGRTHGIQGLEECVLTKTIVADWLPQVRQPWWFPYGAGLQREVDGYARLAHGRSLRERLSGIGATLRLLARR